MLKFDPVTHDYILEGRRLVSVTEALSLIDERWFNPWYLQRGKFVHLATALFDRGELDEETIDPAISAYFMAYKTFLTETKFKPQWIELPNFHPVHQYAGTFDRQGMLNGNEVIIDLKSGSPAKVDSLQLAAYWELCRVNGLSVSKTFTLYLHDDGRYSLKEIEKPRILLYTFLAVLTAYRFKEGL